MKSKPSMLSRFVAGLSWVSVALLWLCAASVYVSPAWCRWLGIIGLGFPVLVCGTTFMLVVCLLFAPRRSWIPLLGLVGVAGSLRTYFPVNLSHKPPKEAIKVMTYNTLSFGGGGDPMRQMFQYVAGSGCQVVCFQEALQNKKVIDDELIPQLRPTLPHFSWQPVGDVAVAIASAYKIVRQQMICHSDGNAAIAYWMLRSPADTLLVVNCHLISNQLSPEERTEYYDIVKKPENQKGKTALHTSYLLARKVSLKTQERALQADSVAEFLECHVQHTPTIVCGDFNDSPISYTRYRIARTGLTDAYRATATGLGRSFNRDAIVVRIDHMFCSSHLKPWDAHLDNTVHWSDHYPMIAYFTPQ